MKIGRNNNSPTRDAFNRAAFAARPSGQESNVRVLLDIATKVHGPHGVTGIALLSVIIFDPGKIQ